MRLLRLEERTEAGVLPVKLTPASQLRMELIDCGIHVISYR